MQIGLKMGMVKLLKEKTKSLDGLIGWSTENRLKENSFAEDDYMTVNLADLSKPNLSSLLKLLTELKAPAKTCSTVSTWIENLNNPHNALVTSLQQLEKILVSAIKETTPSWIMKTNPDGMLVPYAVSQIKYKGRSREDEAYVYLKLSSIQIKSGRWDDDEITLGTHDSSLYFYNSDVKKADNDEDFIFQISEDSDDDYDDEDSETLTKKKKKIVKGDYQLSKILANKGVMLMTEQNFKEYKLQLSEYLKVSKSIGNVYTSTSKAKIIEDKKNGYERWKNLNDEDKLCKLVVDVIKAKETSASVTFNEGKNVEVPTHPYVFTYNLTNYCYASVHVSNLEKYMFDESIIEKLVISDKKKSLLSSLISTKNNFSDIISGKSGGIIILGSGKPGTGKTLTAEVYSELMKKPLYSIQSSQLGINIEDIEKNLNKVLYRADKWDAVLLIDEADAYVYKRENNIVQNCIVGTFLRLLEYYNGVLFLTTNRPDIIDDAIMSRVTAHVIYDYPSKEEIHKIWQILSENFRFKISTETINELIETYHDMSGRDVRNLLKMLSKCFSKEKNIKFSMIESIEDFIPFLKRKK